MLLARCRETDIYTLKCDHVTKGSWKQALHCGTHNRLASGISWRSKSNFCRTFKRNYCRAQVAVTNRLCTSETISVGFVAAISQGFRTCLQLDANMQSDV